MLRLFLRFLGTWAVAGGVVFIVIDGARSIAATTLTITHLAQTWALLGGAPHSGAQIPWPLDRAVDYLMNAPTAAVLVALGFVLLAAGRKRHRGYPGGEYAT